MINQCFYIVILVQLITLLYLMTFKGVGACGNITKAVESMRPYRRPKWGKRKQGGAKLYESMLGFEDIEEEKQKHGLILNSEAFSGKVEPYIPKKDDAELNKMLLVNNHLLDHFKSNYRRYSPEHMAVDTKSKESHKQFAEYALQRNPKKYYSNESFTPTPATAAMGPRVFLAAARSRKGGI